MRTFLTNTAMNKDFQQVHKTLLDRIHELEEELDRKNKAINRLHLRIMELEHLNQKYHRNLQRFAPGDPVVEDC